MECPQKNGNGAELVVAYVARTLDSGAEAAFHRHLESCASCREMTIAQQAVWAVLDEWAPAPVASNFDEKLYQRIASAEQSGWWRRLIPVNWSWRPAMPMAAAFAALFLAFFLNDAGPTAAPQQLSQPKLQIEQVESALDDMDMLKQAGVEGFMEKDSPRERI